MKNENDRYYLKDENGKVLDVEHYPTSVQFVNPDDTYFTPACNFIFDYEEAEALQKLHGGEIISYEPELPNYGGCYFGADAEKARAEGKLN